MNNDSFQLKRSKVSLKNLTKLQKSDRWKDAPIHPRKSRRWTAETPDQIIPGKSNRLEIPKLPNINSHTPDKRKTRKNFWTPSPEMSSQETQTMSDEEIEYFQPVSEIQIKTSSSPKPSSSSEDLKPANSVYKNLRQIEIKTRERLQKVLKRNTNSQGNFDSCRQPVFLDPVEKSDGPFPVFKSPKKVVVIPRAVYSFKQHDSPKKISENSKTPKILNAQMIAFDNILPQRQRSLKRFDHTRHSSLFREPNISLGIRARHLL
ncbi:unnamed protein product [Blepharisma stoltei]|uniref:Testicular haploid expressed protein n=1 Tax=Blepharisma stoltei TaxID=1481888 RepID=A0AAU9ITA8_9CILI|nr:unnamed protein product [Blepharisma stoltei]